MNAQEIFDTVVNHLFTQGKPAREIGKLACRYRTSDGLKCAVGCLIPDREYVSQLEYNAVGILAKVIVSNFGHLDNFPTIKSFKDHIKLLEDLQVAHDNNAPRAGMFDKEILITDLKEVAENHSLEYKGPTS